MKLTGLIFALLSATAWDVEAQGRVWFYTPTVQTHLWSADGPVAGPGIWGQLLAGPTADNLSPVGAPAEHYLSGVISAGIIEVPTVPCDTYGYVQMAAWDGILWGTVIEGVPLDQFGYTDVVSVPMTCFPAPTSAPPFTQPAIVPVPEPSVLALAMLALGVLFVPTGKSGSKVPKASAGMGGSPVFKRLRA